MFATALLSHRCSALSPSLAFHFSASFQATLSVSPPANHRQNSVSSLFLSFLALAPPPSSTPSPHCFPPPPQVYRTTLFLSLSRSFLPLVHHSPQACSASVRSHPRITRPRTYIHPRSLLSDPSTKHHNLPTEVDISSILLHPSFFGLLSHRVQVQLDCSYYSLTKYSCIQFIQTPFLSDNIVSRYVWQHRTTSSYNASPPSSHVCFVRRITSSLFISTMSLSLVAYTSLANNKNLPV